MIYKSFKIYETKPLAHAGSFEFLEKKKDFAKKHGAGEGSVRGF